MNILIDIGHPAHVHYFKNAILRLEKNGHRIKLIARDRDITFYLLDQLGLQYINRGKGRNSRLGKFLYTLKAEYIIFKESLKFKPDIFLSFTSPYVAHVSFLLKKPHIALNDTEHVDRFNKLVSYPYCSSILTPSSYLNDLGEKQVRFKNVIEGLYLHRNYFKPDKDIYTELGLNNREEYIILRFVSWNAHHDFGHSGLDIETKRNIIDLLKEKYRVFISSEEVLPKEFADYKLTVPSERMHDILYYASLYIGESATMASESAFLGTKSIYINSLPLMGYLSLEKEFGLLSHFKSSEGVLDYIKNIIDELDIQTYKIESKNMQKGFIDPTRFLIWFIEDFPKSKGIMRERPDYQINFI